MNFMILNKRMLENDGIKNIVDRIEEYASIFTLDQQRSLDVPFDIVTRLTLMDYDRIADGGVGAIYNILTKEITDDGGLDRYNYILPIIRFEEIKHNSHIINNDTNTLTIQYGKGLTSGISTSEDWRKIKLSSMMNNITETNRKITIFLSKDGKKIQTRVFKNKITEEEYVFMKKKDDGTFDDSLDMQATFIGVVSTLEWKVDKDTGLAICSNPLFLAERCRCVYGESELSKFLKSDEFFNELGMIPEKNIEKRSSIKNPFGEKKEKLNLEQKIRRILMGESRIPYLVGHPGIGKTQIAKSINENCLSFNMATFTPDSFTGKTSIIPGDKIITQEGDKTVEHNEKGRTAITEPEWHTKLVELSDRCRQSNERCVLLLDEFDKLTPNMQVFINGIVDNPRTIAGWEIPNNVDIILAGNTEEYSDAAFNISGEVASRLTKIEVSADVIDWLKWASKHDIDPIVRAYLHYSPNKIIHDVKNKYGEYDPAMSLTPRSWDQKISEELKASRKIHSFPYLDPYMDEQSRQNFEEFISTYFELGVEEILKGNTPTDILNLTDDQILMIINCLIATATTEEEITNALAFIRQTNLKEYESAFETRWAAINDTREDISRLRLAKNSLNERRTSYGI